MRTSLEKGTAFRDLHARPGAFIIPNPWDIGTAHLLAQLGFEALATTSAGYAFSAGRRDNQISRDEMLAHVATIVSATDLPVSADLENGYGADLNAISETYRLAGAAGLAGASIEDATQRAGEPLFEREHAADRVRAAVAAVRALPFPFTLTARAENILVGRPDLKDAIRRLQAYQEAGADALYIPGLTSREDIAAVVSSVDRPVNVLMGMQGVQLSLAELAGLGVRRVSVGSALTRAAYGAFLRAAREMREHGTFTFAGDAVPFQAITQMF
jgi:2-methylisocitrate lyase-like PEP mutase family enzyme